MVEAIQIAQPYVFTAFAFIALAQWWRHRGDAGAWLVAAFWALAIVVVMSALLPEESSDPMVVWAKKSSIAILVLFPYFLYRFMASLMPPVRWVQLIAAPLTAAVALGALLLPSFPSGDDARPVWFQVYIIALLVQWVFLSSRVVVRLWRAGHGQPPVARRRMHMMALGAASLAVALVIAGEFSSQGGAETAVQLLTFAAPALLLLGFAPPYFLRARWRREEVDAAKEIQRSLMTATTARQVSDTLLPHTRRMLGASEVVLENAAGKTIGRDVADQDTDGSSRLGTDVAPVSEFVIPMETHLLRIVASSVTPFFGQEEIRSLESLAALAELALTRNALLNDQQRLAAIVESSSSAILSKTLDGIITSWNLGAEKLYGYRAAEIVGKPVSLLIPPGHEDEGPAMLDRVSSDESVDHYETKRKTKDGRILDVSITISPIKDADGDVVGASTIARDITERVRLETDLMKATGAAEDANRAKSEFLSRMSHELRTPLNAILGFGQILEMDELTPDQRDSLTQMIKGGRRLLQLINEVLDISRIESGTMQLSLEPVPIGNVVADAVALIRPLAEERGIRLRNELQTDMAKRHVIADQQRVGQILLNLLSNAVKYNVRDGSVSVTAAETDDSLRIGITDTGPGIPDEKIPMLFTPFERLGADASGVEGTGLGLALSKSLVEAMGGRLEVDTMMGQGTTFWVELHQAEGPPEDEISDEEIAEPTGTGGKILYIEDNLSNLKLIERLLVQTKRLEVISAMTGTLGLEMAQQHLPDLILLDLHLPDVSGDEILVRLRKDPRTKPIPIVILSADATPGQIKRLRSAGADEYVTKPIDVTEFLAVVERFLEPA